MPNGSLALADYPGDVVHISCERCGRAGSYRRDGLIQRFGADAALPDPAGRVGGTGRPRSSQRAWEAVHPKVRRRHAGELSADLAPGEA